MSGAFFDNAEARPGLRVIALLVVALAGCGADEPRSPRPVRWGGQTMGTTYSVALAALPEGATQEDFAAAVEAELAEVNRQMSTWDPDSELSRFNASDSTDWFPVSAETAAVTALALEIAADSGGAFDPTVGPLVDLWGFGDGPRPTRVPTEEELAAVRASVGYKRLHVRDDPPALRKDVPGLRVDLSAIAKGHGVDRVADRLTAAGASDFLVEVGGELRAAGTKASGERWRAGVETPVDDVTGARRDVRRGVPLGAATTTAALATSGNYRNFYQLGTETVVHTIDPRTGRPATVPEDAPILASVSVAAADCATADALATATMVLGPEEGRDLLERRGVAALLILRVDGAFREAPTAEWRRLFDGP